MRSYGKWKIAVINTAVLLLGIAPDVHAVEKFYIGAMIPYNMIGGDFDNSHMPEVDAGVGLGAILGYKVTKGLAFEVDWSDSKLKSSGATVDFTELSVNAKYSFPDGDPVQPYVFAGVGKFTLGDSSLTLGGTGFNLGLGVDYYFNPKMSWGAGLFWKSITYDTIEKSDVPVILVGNLSGNTTSFRLDLKYHF